jgi:fructose-1,6-bisphosphatase/inositol monophosphatase family enzyme
MDGDLDLLRAMADEVEDAIGDMSFGERNEAAGIGADGLPAHRIDRVAEAAVLDVLEDAPVELNVCSEEHGVEDVGADRTIVVDPIDGTRNARRGIPFYCVSLAITSGGIGDVEAAFVRNIPADEDYTAIAGDGAYRNGEPISVAEFDPEEAIRSPILVSPVDTVAAGPLEQAPHGRGLGAAALEMCMVAQGSMDAFLHLTDGLRVVDVAAGTLIVEEAGGFVLEPDGSPPDVPLDPSAGTSLVAVGDEQVLSEPEVAV